jgi:hypothetical protein
MAAVFLARGNETKKAGAKPGKNGTLAVNRE